MIRIAAPSLLLGVLLNAGGCAFDATPHAVSQQRMRNTATAYWTPPVHRGQIVGTAQLSDAGLDGGDSAPASERDAGAPDAGMPVTAQPEQSTAKPRAEGGAGASEPAAAGSGNAAGSVSKPSEPDGLCSAGQYAGTFEGSVTFLQGSFTGVTGTIRAAMVLDPAGDYLRVRDGSVTGVNDQGVKMNAGWTGALNCKTGELEGAVLTNGAWDNGSRFSGMLAGTYSNPSSSLSGTWQVRSDELVWAGGNGTWSMRRSAAGGNEP